MSGLIVSGKFIGTTSCGFVTGQQYQIKICARRFGKVVRDTWLWVFDTNSSAKCPYASIKLLADNWEIPAKGEIKRETPVSNRIWDD